MDVTARTIRRWRDDAVAFFADALTLPDGRRYGAALDPWQAEDFRGVAAHRQAYLSRPRGHSKTADMAAWALHHVLTTPGARAYVFAADRDQAALVRDTVGGFVQRSALLQAALVVTRFEVAAPSTDAKLEVMAADAASSWGLRPSLAIVDELQAWRTERHAELFHAVASAMGKVAGAKLLVGTTAHWDRTGLCWRVRELARQSPDWYFAERGQCASWVAPEFLRQQRALLPAHVYDMLHENRWTDAGAEFLTWAELEAVFAGDVPAGTGPAVLGVDLATARDRSAVAVVRLVGDVAVVAALATWAGSPDARVRLGEVQEAIVGLAARHGTRGVVLDPYQGVLLAEQLRARGLGVAEYPFTGPSRAALFETLLQLIRQRRLRCAPGLREAAVLREELAGLRWVEKAGVLRPDHPAGGHDDAVVAVALAARALVERPAPARIDPEVLGALNAALARKSRWRW